MRKRTKAVIGILAGTMLLGTVTGCGGKEAAKDGAKPELKVLMNYMKEDPNTYPVAKDLEEATGYPVKYYTLPQDKPEEKLNLIMASNEAYDIIITTNNLRVSWADYAKKGALLELDELVDQYGANMKKAMKPESFDLMRMEGKLYGIPVPKIKIGKSLNYTSMLVTRSDMLEKSGAKYPETLDEFTAMLRAMKTAGAEGETIAPLCIKQMIELPGVVGAFGVPNLWNEVDGKLVSRVEDPRYLDYIRYMKSLYQEGLLDKEFPVNKSATLSEKFSSGRAGIIPITYSEAGTISNALAKNSQGAELTFLDAVSGKNGEMGIGTGESSLDRLVFIPKTAVHPEDAVKYMDAKLDEETFKLVAIGREGEHYKVEDGEYYPIAPKFFDERGSANNYLTGINEETYPGYWQTRVRKEQAVYDAYQYMSLDDERLEDAVANPVLDAPVFDSDKYVKIVNQMANDYFIKVIAGEEDLDAGYDKFLEKWRSEGGAAISEDLNSWYQSKTN